MPLCNGECRECRSVMGVPGVPSSSGCVAAVGPGRMRCRRRLTAWVGGGGVAGLRIAETGGPCRRRRGWCSCRGLADGGVLLPGCAVRCCHRQGVSQAAAASSGAWVRGCLGCLRCVLGVVGGVGVVPDQGLGVVRRRIAEVGSRRIDGIASRGSVGVGSRESVRVGSRGYVGSRGAVGLVRVGLWGWAAHVDLWGGAHVRPWGGSRRGCCGCCLRRWDVLWGMGFGSVAVACAGGRAAAMGFWGLGVAGFW
ncbi:hypothetical protein SAMN05421869_10153 [Nonomuraea jiangxiensis]|uniref:Uncharacterized protein n=1 Tax=Nonomuraea jiangxiensis TaxID=633440 RepID=A0A1G7YA16_9ACTN|nr:hypothetical protein SAMN05421869_10153 [Nonomuraea jiangxiensis]